MVTKQQQLEWLAKEFDVWPGFGHGFVRMSTLAIGEPNGVLGIAHHITLQEWQQERDKMSSKPEVDNSWHERGELPPVGCECSAMCDGNWVTVEVLRHRVNNAGMNVAAVMNCASFNVFWATDFRPLRTEREKAIDEMVGTIKVAAFQDPEFTASILYDAGYRKVKP